MIVIIVLKTILLLNANDKVYYFTGVIINNNTV